MRMNYRAINMNEAINLAVTDAEACVYILQPITAQTTIETLSTAKGFVVETEDIVPAPAPAPEVKAKPKAVKRPEIDHNKIVALYTANPPWSASKIADEVGCSIPTVISHLEKEGIYKAKGERNDEDKG